MIEWLINKREGVIWITSTRLVRFQARLMRIASGEGLRCSGLPIIRQIWRGSIRIGKRVIMISRSPATALGFRQPVMLRCLTAAAHIHVGNDTGLSGVVICAAQSVTIGRRCLLDASVVIFDTDFHPHEPENRRYRKPDWSRISSPVTIGDDVFVGTGSIIQRGVSIGNDAIIVAGSIVVKDVAPTTIVGGNPAVFLKNIVVDAPVI